MLAQRMSRRFPAPVLPVPMAQLCEGCWVAGTLPIPHTSLMVVPLPPPSPPKSVEAKLRVQEGHRNGAITATQGQWGSNAALTFSGGLCCGKAELFSLPAASCCGIGCEAACVLLGTGWEWGAAPPSPVP